MLRSLVGLLSLVPLLEASRLSSFHSTRAMMGIGMPPSMEHLYQLRGGDAGTITVRVRTADGMKRATISAEASLLDLQKMLAKEHKMPLARQKMSKDKASLGEEDRGKTLSSLGIEHGTLLQLDMTPAADGGGSKPGATASASSGGGGAGGGLGRRRGRRSQTMADFEAERSEFEIILQTPGASTAQYLSVEPDAGKVFADFLLDSEFEERRVALLFGRWVDEEASGGKRGVLVDVLYEPPQECTEDAMAIEGTSEAHAEVARATKIAQALGLTTVGFAFAHPPRFHTLEVPELQAIVEQQRAAAEADPVAKDLFVGVRFRAVYEDEPIDGDVTAEAYQPTEQAAELVGKGALVDGPPNEEGELKIGPDIVQAADLSYFVSRVHDMAKPYVAPGFGSFRHTFPLANRGQAPLRKFHLRTFLERQREAGVPFGTFIIDFQMLLHVSALLPSALFDNLCAGLVALPTAARGKARDAAQTKLDEAERWLCKYAGVEAK